MAVEIVAGLHFPAIPLVDVSGNAVGESPTQNGPMAANTGLISSVMVILMVAAIAHSPGSGVNTYEAGPSELVETTDGFHVPLKPSVEVVGKA